MTAGIGIIGLAKTMVSEMFARHLPEMATEIAAGVFVVLISLANMFGAALN